MNQQSFILQLLLIVSVKAFVPTQKYTMKTLSVVFRHGDRLPSAFYPNDPNQENSTYPYSPGDLNNQGKRREYQLGHLLRQRYDKFLGVYYRPADIFAISTDVGRTRMSLLLVLASLYPPKEKQVWNRFLNWQPVSSYGYLPQIMDPILLYLESCPAYVREYNHVQNSPEFKEKLSKFNGLMKNLSQITGEPITHSADVYNLYLDLVAELSSNLKISDKIRPYFLGEPMFDETMLEYELQNYNTQLKRLNGGSIIRKILSTIQHKNSTKLNLYSAHENNVAGILYALNLWDRSIPQFSSAVLFEHYEYNSEKFIKVIYYRGIPPIFEELTIPGCTPLCPVKKFLYIAKKIIPNDPIEECFGPAANSTLVPDNVDPIKWIYEQIQKWYSF